MIFGIRALGLSPSYIRMVGDITLERFEGDEVVEKLTENGIWEQMYFGQDEDV